MTCWMTTQVTHRILSSGVILSLIVDLDALVSPIGPAIGRYGPILTDMVR
jgi:hypothetical protein